MASFALISKDDDIGGGEAAAFAQLARRHTSYTPRAVRCITHISRRCLLIELSITEPSAIVWGTDEAAQRMSLFEGLAWLESSSAFLASEDVARRFRSLDPNQLHGSFYRILVDED